VEAAQDEVAQMEAPVMTELHKRVRGTRAAAQAAIAAFTEQAFTLVGQAEGKNSLGSDRRCTSQKEDLGYMDAVKGKTFEVPVQG
jgi:hypothetical protein